MQIKKEEKLKILIFSICSFVVIFIGVICGFSLNNLKNDSKKLPDELKKNTNILLIFLDEGKKEADGIFAVSLDPKNNKIDLDDIPRTAKTVYDGADDTFRGIYSENGAEALKECVGKEKNIKFDKYICLDRDLLEKTVNTTGDIAVDFKGAVSFSQKGENFSFEKGENLLNPVQFALCFAYLCRDGEKKDNKPELLKSFFKRLSGADFAPWQQKEFLNIVKQSKTDIASYDFDDLAKIFSSMDNAEITVKQ